MPNTHSTLTSLFSDIADAIRAKTGSSETIVADDFPTAIANIPTGGGGITTTEVANATGTTLEITSGGGGGGTTVNVGFTGASTNPKICYIDANGIYHSESASYDSSTHTYYWSASVLENSVVIIFYDAAYSGAQYANLYQEELISLGYRANWTGALFMRAVAQ